MEAPSQALPPRKSQADCPDEDPRIPNFPSYIIFLQNEIFIFFESTVSKLIFVFFNCSDFQIPVVHERKTGETCPTGLLKFM